MRRAALLAVMLGTTPGCGDDEPTPTTPSTGGTPSGIAPPVECHTVAPRACAPPSPRYQPDIKPIVDTLCLSCHLGAEDGPWALTDYEHLADWHDLLRSVMLDCSMPPADSGLDMSTEQRQLMLSWLRCGFPE